MSSKQGSQIAKIAATQFLVVTIGISLLVLALTGYASAAEPGVCEALPKKFSEIKSHLARYDKEMKDEDIEKAITNRGYANKLAFSIHELFDDINDWISQGRACKNVSQAAIEEEETLCGKQAEEFLTNWNREQTGRATVELDRNRKIAVGKILMVKRRSACFVGLESRLFSVSSQR